MRGVGVQVEAARRGRHGLRREEGALQKDVARGRGDAAAFAAHDAGDGDRAAGVGDQQHGFVGVDAASVEQGDGFAGASVAHHDAAVELVEVEGVHGLAEFQQHIVRHVHHGIDGTQPATAQPFAHPQRRAAAGVGVGDDAAEIARAAGEVLDGDREFRIDRRRHRGDGRRRDWNTVQEAHFAGETADAQAVATVRGQVEVDGHVVQLHRFAQVLAQREGARQFQQPAGVVAQAQLGFAAKHPRGRHAAQRRLVDLPGAVLGGEFRAHLRERILAADGHV